MKLQKRQTNSHLYQDKGNDSEQKEIEEQYICDDHRRTEGEDCTVREDERRVAI
jgi:hypothetical protein